MALGANFYEDPDYYSDVPVLYIHGQGDNIMKYYDDGSCDQVYHIVLPEGYIESYLTPDNLKMFAKCYFTNDYSDFEDMLVDAVVPLFEDVKLDKSGMPRNNTRLWDDGSWRLFNNNVNGMYDIQWFEVGYDWRMDPCDVIDVIHNWLVRIKELTGKDKIAILGRCLGASVMTAYIDKYGTDDISDIILYTSALDGSTCMSRAFAGKLYVDENGIERFLYDTDLSELLPDETVVRFIRAFITAYNKVGGVKWALNEVNRVYQLIAGDITPRLLRESYATFPGYWAMVEDEDFEDAKALIFGGEEVQWAELIKKIDNFHYNIFLKSDEILKKAEEAGVHIYNIEKYGIQEIPVVKPANVVSDRVVELSKCTKGATTMPLGSTFSDDYIAKAFDAGTAKYISPDRQVDASTCMFRDTTWIIKDMDHMDFDYCVDELIAEILNSHGTMTVFSNPKYPQYMVFEKENHKIVPMTNENCNTTPGWNTNGWEAIRFVIFNFKYVLDYVLNMLGISLF